MSRSRRGLTFLEIEMALLLLLLGVLAVIEIAPLALQGVRLAEQQALGGQFAQHVLEVEMADRYDAVLSRVSTQSASDSWILPFPQYKRTPTVLYPYDIVIPGAPAITYAPTFKPMYTYFVDRRAHPTLGSDVIVLTVEVKWNDPNARRASQAGRIFRLVGYKTK